MASTKLKKCTHFNASPAPATEMMRPPAAPAPAPAPQHCRIAFNSGQDIKFYRVHFGLGSIWFHFDTFFFLFTVFLLLQ
jgi:hypothetical protein